MNETRRQFLARSAGSLIAGTAIPRMVFSADEPLNGPGPGSGKTVSVSPRDGAELQRELLRHAGTGNTLRLAGQAALTAVVREDAVGPQAEKSIHALLVPQGVRLDLNGSTLLLEMKSNSYGVRLTSDSALRNGTIRITQSAGKGSQACWHSGISVGAAYGDGGTPDTPGYFSRVANWAVEDVTIDQPFAAAAIQLMSEACFGLIRNVTIADSAQALLGIGMDWGSVGPLTSEDREIPRMRRLWERGEIYSTHPHNVLIDTVRVGKLLRNIDGNDAGVRCSACHEITIRNVTVATAATAVAIFGGDLGYEFARDDLRAQAHQGYRLDGIRIDRALKFGLVLNGLADNVWRACRYHGYDAVRDATKPGIDRPEIRNLDLRGAGGKSQGLYAVSVTRAEFNQVRIEGFEIGVHAEDWVRGMRIANSQVAGNAQNTRIEGVREAAVGVTFVD